MSYSQIQFFYIRVWRTWSITDYRQTSTDIPDGTGRISRKFECWNASWFLSIYLGLISYREIKRFLIWGHQKFFKNLNFLKNQVLIIILKSASGIIGFESKLGANNNRRTVWAYLPSFTLSIVLSFQIEYITVIHRNVLTCTKTYKNLEMSSTKMWEQRNR